MSIRRGVPHQIPQGQPNQLRWVGMELMPYGLHACSQSGHDCAQDIKRLMIERAAGIWDVSADDVELADGVFQHTSDPDLKFTFKELAGQYFDAKLATQQPDATKDDLEAYLALLSVGEPRPA